MDVRDIELIRAVQEEGSISRACVRLHMSQPTLSKKLARLEQVLAIQLFHRAPKGLIATETARYIINQADALRSQLAEIERHVELINQLDTGQLRLGVGPIIEQLMLPEVLKMFAESTGNVQLSIVAEDEPVLLEMLRTSELDVVVGPFDVEAHGSANLLALPMLEDFIVAVVRSGHPLLEEAALGIDKLAEYDWVAPKVQGTVQQTDDHPIFNKMKILSDNYSVMKQLTVNSDVVCAGPSAVFRHEVAAKSLVEIPAPFDITWKSALLVKPQTYATPLGRHLVSLFESARDGYRHAG